MTLAEQLLVLVAGFAAGVLTSTVGVASLASFPVLLALGIPPVVANASNTIGLTPAGLSGSWGYREELREQPRLAWVIIVTCGLGSVGGAALLLALQPGVFERVVPCLILFTCLLVGVQPGVTRWLRRRTPDAKAGTFPGPVTTALSVLTGAYGGYFGAGSGVMMVAVLGFGLDLDLRVVNGLKTMAVAAANVVASVIFMVVADLDWSVVAVLALGSIGGGYVGSRIGRRLPPTMLRTLIVVAGVIAAVALA
ncbi:sulfite exporter TauE/SafE family protein [Micromonospora deserti]|uniref:Probable membrane transporter protein n=1 Tax=Micromonospora deserti TaxID=2070366 RepID=A0A2W2DYN8_9ACTN|nr:sulfite exporter TauE/SafE family protein [Micromonospora deserti]PZG02337.1 sulfite exporter TauE/SafE family protein [Micromonospora deserti]